MIKTLTVVLFISFLAGCTGSPKTKLSENTSLTLDNTSLTLNNTSLTLENTIFAKKSFLNLSECSVIPPTEEEKSIKRSMVLLEHFFEEWKSSN